MLSVLQLRKLLYIGNEFNLQASIVFDISTETFYFGTGLCGADYETWKYFNDYKLEQEDKPNY